MTASPRLQELLFLMRQHDAFGELLAAVEGPDVLKYTPSKGSVAEQQAEWIFRSGRRAQQELWRAFLTENAPTGANPTLRNREIP